MLLGNIRSMLGSPGKVLLSPATITSTPFDIMRVAKLCLASSVSYGFCVELILLAWSEMSSVAEDV